MLESASDTLHRRCHGGATLIEQRDNGRGGLLAKSSSLNGAEWKLPPVAQWCEPGESEHLVQFYESDTFLLNSLNSFVGNGLAAGDTCVVVANKTHRHSLEAGLQASGLDLDLVRSSGQYVALDSSE